MKNKLLSLFLLISALAPAQDQAEIGKIKARLRSARPDSSKVDLLYRLSKQYWSNNLDTALLLTNEALGLAQALDYTKGLGNAYNGLGVIHWYKGEYNTALQYNHKALIAREKTGDTIEIANSYNNIGLLYDDQGDFPNAMRYYLNALKLYEECNDLEGVAQEHNNIGLIFYNQRNYREALASLNKALPFRLSQDDKWGLSESYSNIGLCHYELKEYPGMLANYEKALQLRKAIGDRGGIAISQNNYGDYYKTMGRYEEALEAYTTALAINEEIGFKKSILNNHLSIGSVYELMDKHDEALRHLQKALADAEALNTKDYLAKVYAALSQFHSKKKDFGEAYKYHVLFQQTNDSLFNLSRTKDLTRLQMQFDFSKEQFADSLRFQQEKALGEIKLQRQEAFTYGGFAALAVVIFLLFLVYRNYDKQRIANEKLKETQEQLIRSEKLAAFGVLATRVAHEIQNPLNFVNNFAELNEELVQEIMAPGDEQEKLQAARLLLENCRKINQHGQRAKAIVDQLQEHIRTGTAHKFFEDE